ncbi:MAG: DUF952 domain-containing protein [Ignavibacteria bacterium]|nr:DUF952 domain-containing protein [Ignavibacteria bacterium]
MIYHITFKNKWKEALINNSYKTDSLEKEGFIHCSPEDKISDSANKFFKDQCELIILCIDEKKVKSKIIWEDLYETGFNFPHIYGQLNIDSVIQVTDFIADENGYFKLPEGI